MKVKTRQPVFGPQLEAVLARLCERLGSLYKTQAVKLPYLVDVVAAEKLGRRITDATFEAWKQGVVAREAWVGVTYPREGCFKIEQPEYDEGWTVRLAGRPSVRLSPEELAIVDFVADQYGAMTAQDLGSLTKSLNPEIPREKWGSNTEPAINEDAYARLSEGWQNLWRALPFLDLTDQSQWSDPIEDPDEYFRAAFRA
ncbi:MAG: SocA family protein [Acidobacteria bacterium]|nr:SocA family protein [Acidobacteriota bacterium]